jgi:hypothetical protein
MSIHKLTAGSGYDYLTRQVAAQDVRHTGSGCSVDLPPDYVRTCVDLGYATTIHTAQDVTAETSQTQLTGKESRQLAYTALTRGKAANHLCLGVVGDGDEHSRRGRPGRRPPLLLAARPARR